MQKIFYVALGIAAFLGLAPVHIATFYAANSML
jgi:hypothetical protein